LITGASAGIGKATAIEFARSAAPDPINLVVTARRINVLEELKKEIETKYIGTKVYPVKLDVSNPDEVRGLVKGLPQEVQNVDILINNAYVPKNAALNCSGLVIGMERVGEISEDDIQVMMNTNVIGLINVNPLLEAF
jgi:3-hydroxy acid dehydrogenase/malonic semialdehyde reductase